VDLNAAGPALRHDRPIGARPGRCQWAWFIPNHPMRIAQAEMLWAWQ
jgi:hypothetical protein